VQSFRHRPYIDLPEQHAYVIKKWVALTAKDDGPDASEAQVLDAQSDIRAIDMPFLTSDIAQPFNQNDEVTSSDPDSLLISPLPQFTSVLPRSFSDLKPLPDVGNNFESLYEEFSPRMSAQPPTFCPRVENSSSPEMSPPAVSSRNRSASVLESYSDSGYERDTDLPSLSSTPPSAVNQDIPTHRVARSSSRSSGLSTHSQSHSRLASRPSSPRRPVLSIQASSRIPSPLERGLSTSVVPPAPVIARLHELMEVPSVSSSLPNMSNHFPSSVTRDSHHSRGLRSSRSPSRSRSTSFNVPTPQGHQQSRGLHSDTASSAQPVSIVVKPLSYDPSSSSGPVSSASTAAMALEKAQREQRERQKAEKEQERERRRVDRERGEVLEKEREASERGRSRVDNDRALRHQTSTSASHTPYREHNKVYSSSPAPLDYPAHRIYGSGLGSSAPRDSYSTYKHTTKAIPVPHRAKV
jgi:hypothetical protein